MGKQVEAEPDFETFEQAMDWLRYKFAELQATRQALKQCQAENQRLIEGYRFYCNRENWKTRTAHLDCGAKAREILKEVAGL
jgi:hypothetical protein